MRESASPPLPPVLCGVSGISLCHLTEVVAGRGCGARVAQGLLSPSLRPGSGSVPRSPLSPPLVGYPKVQAAAGTSWPPPRVLMEPPNLYPVKLYVYDLSKGLARRLSPIMLGEGTGVSGK